MQAVMDQGNVMECGVPACHWEFEGSEAGGDSHPWGIVVDHLPELRCAAAHEQAMTENQVEVLRRQISVYTIITRQLVEMHTAGRVQSQAPCSSHMSFDSVLSNSSVRVSARQRWTPSIKQLQILERLFVKGDGAKLDKHRIKEITAELSEHGAIQDANVYNWFQNRKARAKRKQARTQNQNQSETDGELDPERHVSAKKPRTDADSSVRVSVDADAG